MKIQNNNKNHIAKQKQTRVLPLNLCTKSKFTIKNFSNINCDVIKQNESEVVKDAWSNFLEWNFLFK